MFTTLANLQICFKTPTTRVLKLLAFLTFMTMPLLAKAAGTGSSIPAQGWLAIGLFIFWFYNWTIKGKGKLSVIGFEVYLTGEDPLEGRYAIIEVEDYEHAKAAFVEWSQATSSFEHRGKVVLTYPDYSKECYIAEKKPSSWQFSYIPYSGNLP